MAQLIRERFSEAANPFAAGFVASVQDDERLVPADIRGSIAHAQMLRSVGLLTPDEAVAITGSLERILREFQEGKRRLAPELEDVHMNVETWLTDLAGPAGAKLHTGRSRNDQVALDLRLWVRDEIALLRGEGAALQSALLRKAAAQATTIMPGYTHVQRAQPVLLAHVLLSFYEALARDDGRLADTAKRADVSPLGAAALAGTSLPIEPARTAKALGFSSVFANSIDAVSDRDFAVEFVSACALLQTHLSQIAENLLLWSSSEFGFVELPDSLCTSSSLMPQKKNADMVELVRAKSGRVTGALVNLLTILKGLPSGYNRDLQETKPPMFEAAETARASLRAMTLAIDGLSVRAETMLRAASDPQLLATDVAEYLVKKGVAFREAHGVVARVMKHCGGNGTSPERLSLREWKEFSPAFESDVLGLFSPEVSVRNRTSPGGTGFSEVEKRISLLGKEGSK